MLRLRASGTSASRWTHFCCFGQVSFLTKSLAFYFASKDTGVRYGDENLLAQRGQGATSWPSSLASSPPDSKSLPTTSCAFPCVFQTSSNCDYFCQLVLALSWPEVLLNERKLGGPSVIKYPATGGLLSIWLVVLDPCNVLCLFFGQTFKEFWVILCRPHSIPSVAPMWFIASFLLLTLTLSLLCTRDADTIVF